MTSSEDVAAALLLVREALDWSLAPARWAYVDRSVAALTAALAAGDTPAFQDAVTTLELLSPVRGTLVSPVRVPDAVRARLASASEILAEFQQPPAPAAAQFFPVTIFLSEEAIHDQVEQAVDALLQSAGLTIVTRQPPVTGSWSRRMRAVLRSPTGAEVLATTVHMADSRLARRPDAEITAMLMNSVGPVIAALHPTKDAAVRVGSVLIVKVDWMVVVHQLTPRQQLVLDHSPDLESAPHQILHALGLPPAESEATRT